EQAMPKLAAVGARTAAALKDAGMHVSLVPEQGFTSEDLLSLPELQQVADSAVLIIKGEGGRRLIADTLRERGAQVDEIAVYRRVIPETDIQPIVEQINAGDIDLIALTSIEIVENLVTLLGDAVQQYLYDIPVLAGSARIAARAGEIGFKNVFQADDPSDESMSAAVLQWMNSDRA
ncbi:MAG: uroporphyrinogen-III synthase, partial [Gammaproteobacteria bacterium]|nr:uroporphyrinogen-III synthase [Gammaproteobacteria bacterium]